MRAAADEGRDVPDALWEACRAQSRHNLSGLAQRIEPKASWDDLVLPELQHQRLLALVDDEDRRQRHGERLLQTAL